MKDEFNFFDKKKGKRRCDFMTRRKKLIRLARELRNLARQEGIRLSLPESITLIRKDVLKGRFLADKYEEGGELLLKIGAKLHIDHWGYVSNEYPQWYANFRRRVRREVLGESI
ncbi:MAG: hypothetical protein ACP5HC_02130 [Caldisericum sp.]